MSLAIVLATVAALALILVLRLAVSRSLQVSSDSSLGSQLQPIDVEAFRNLADPSENEYLRRRLPASEFRAVQRKRLHAMAAYVQTAGKNAAILIRIGQAALAANDARISEPARQLVNDAILLRRNASFALLKIYVVLAWPHSGLSAAPVLHSYEQMSGSAMLLGRLQNPVAPIRVSAH